MSQTPAEGRSRPRLLRLRPGPGLRYWRTNTFRLTVLFSALFAIGVMAMLGVIYWQTAGYMTRQLDLVLQVESRAFVATAESDLPSKIADALAGDARHIYFFGLFGPDGQQRAGNLPRLPAGLPMDGSIHALSRQDGDWPAPGDVSVRALGLRLPSGAGLVIARDVGALDAIRRIILRALGWWGSLTLVLVVGIGLVLSAGPLRRIAEIQRVSGMIELGDITQRLPVAGRKDELDMLAAIVNAMLEEIERLMNEVKSVCDNIAHDLRTPLTRLRGQLYRLQQQADSGEPHRVLLDGAVADTDALLARFRALLRISEIEDRHRRTGFAAVDPAHIVAQLVELYEPLAEDRGVCLRSCVDAKAALAGDGELIFEALSNLVDNAIKFSPPSGVVEIRLLRGGAGPQIEITDQGPGIPADERQTILQRFYRNQQSRDVPGHGLGLSIVAAIIRLHGFRLEFESVAEGGTRAILKCWGLPQAGV